MQAPTPKMYHTSHTPPQTNVQQMPPPVSPKPCGSTMSCDSNRAVRSDSSPTLWEHFVMHKASEKKVMLFDLEIDDKKRINANSNKKRKLSALDAATAVAMKERGRSVSAPANISVAVIQDSKTANKEAGEGPLTVAPHITLSPIASRALTPTSNSQSSTSLNSIFFGSHHHIEFGPAQLQNLSSEIQEVDTELQELLINSRPIEGLTMKRRFKADQHDEQLMMSGALDIEDGRCEVYAARYRAMSGLEEAGSVAL